MKSEPGLIQYDAVVAGHICLDIIPDLSAIEDFRRHFLPGNLLRAGAATISTGGAVSNTGLALHRLGARTRLMGKIGKDLFGQAIMQVIKSHGADLADGMIQDSSASSSYTVIINPPGVDRIFLHCPGANDSFGCDDLDYSCVAQARLFHFGYPTLMKRMRENGGADLAEMFQKARASGVTTSLDLSFPDTSGDSGGTDWSRILKATLPHIDVFMPSLEEILLMLKPAIFRQLSASSFLLDAVSPDLLSELGRELIDMGVALVGLKLGERGFYLRTAADARVKNMGRAGPADVQAWACREMWIPCFQVRLAGTTGAGDATIAGFLNAMLLGYDPVTAATGAVAVGACNVEAPDALGGLRTWEETMARVRCGWPRRPLHLQARGWYHDSLNQLWFGPCD